MCDCGCNTCETKGPLLTEGKVKSLLSEGLQYHIDKKIPLFETVYRIGSDKHLALIKEARKMYSRNVIDLCEEDEALIGTHLGEFGIYEGESVPLDLPMLEQTYSGFLRNPEDPDSEKFEPTGSVSEFKEDLRALFGKFKGDLKNPEFIKGVAQIMVNWKSLLRSQMSETDVDEGVIGRMYDKTKKKVKDYLNPFTEDEVDEASMSGAAGAYNTPYAFVRKPLKPKSSKKKKKSKYKMSKPSGLVNYLDYAVKEGIGATLGPGPKAGEDGVNDNAYVKQFKYKLVKKNKDGTYVQPPSTLPVRKLWGE